MLSIVQVWLQVKAWIVFLVGYLGSAKVYTIPFLAILNEYAFG